MTAARLAIMISVAFMHRNCEAQAPSLRGSSQNLTQHQNLALNASRFSRNFSLEGSSMSFEALRAPTRFMSWNVFYGGITGRAVQIAQAIKQVGPEIVSLQETVEGRHSILEELKQQTGQEWAMTAGAGCEWEWDGIILFRADLWETLENGAVPYGGGGCFSNDRRALNWAAMRRISDGAGVLVFGTHPVCCQGDGPIEQALHTVTSEMAAKRQKYDFPIVLMADMNTGYFQRSQQMLREGSFPASFAFHDAWAEKNPGNPDISTINNAPVRLDYVYFEKTRNEMSNAVGSQIWNLPGGSDHRAISADVIIGH